MGQNVSKFGINANGEQQQKQKQRQQQQEQHLAEQQQRAWKRQRIRQWMEEHARKFYRRNKKKPDTFNKFSDLPAELRVIIYEYYFASVEVDPTQGLRNFETPGLLATCVFIRTEAFHYWIRFLESLKDEVHVEVARRGRQWADVWSNFYGQDSVSLQAGLKCLDRYWAVSMLYSELGTLLAKENTQAHHWYLWLEVEYWYVRRRRT